MSCKTETKEIGEHEYSVTQWPVEKAMVIKFKLAKAFGAPIAAMMGDTDKDESVLLSEGLSVLFLSNSPEELVGLIKQCVIGTACDGKRITESSFSELFSGDDMIEVYKVFVFVLRVNYSNLFTGQKVSDLLAKVKEKL